MNGLIEVLKEKWIESDDFKTETICFEEKMEVVGLESMIDWKKTIDIMKRKVLEQKNQLISIDSTLEQLGEKCIKEAEAMQKILEGKLILSKSSSPFVYIVEPYTNEINRSVDSPTNENVIQGSLKAFNEHIFTNIGIMRYHYQAEALRIKTVTFGQQRKSKVAVLYVQGATNQKIVSDVMKQIRNNQHKELHDLQDLARLLGLNTKIAIPQINTTELPQDATKALIDGRIVLFIDNLPLAIIVPSVIWDMFVVQNDQNFNLPLLIAIRSLRVLGFIISLILPGLYVALVAVNPELLRIELALSIAQSRDGVPYPAFIEIVLMLVIMDLIIEASVRLPSSIGPTITMVGGIILGQAVVDAKLVSNMLIIVLAAATIAASTINGFQNSLPIRLFKYIIVILAAVFGILGILVGILAVCTYLSGIKTFGVPYINFSFKKGVKNEG